MAKKIMFSDKYGLSAAVLNGTKTQTRRSVSEFLKDANTCGFNRLEIVGNKLHAWNDSSNTFIEYNIPYKVGEIVAVAQAYKDINANESYASLAGWSNKMFVKAEDMPHQIRITRVWIERLQDISDEDCLKEGMFYDEDEWFTFHNADKGVNFGNARVAYAALIDKISGKGVWDSNPYVYCYEFELVK